MYLLKGVVMFTILNIDVADKNPEYKQTPKTDPSQLGENNTPTSGNSNSTADNAKEGNACSTNETQKNQVVSDTDLGKNTEEDANAYSPEIAYRPKRNIRKHLEFTKDEGEIINSLRDTNDLGNKIYNVVFELSKLDLQVHRYSIAYLYRTLIERLNNIPFSTPTKSCHG